MKQNFNAILESINKKEVLIANNRNKNDTRDLIVLMQKIFLLHQNIFIKKMFFKQDTKRS